jgi:hypothetical protein
MQLNNDYKENKENNENREGTDMPQGARFSPYTVYTHIPQHWRAVAIVASTATSGSGEFDTRTSAIPFTMSMWQTREDGMLNGGEKGCELRLIPTHPDCQERESCRSESPTLIHSRNRAYRHRLDAGRQINPLKEAA